MNGSVIPNLEVHGTTLSAVCINGFSIALNVVNVTPQAYYCTYDPDWLERYLKGSYALSDPCVSWAMLNKGVTRWSEIVKDVTEPSSLDLMKEAVAAGLRFGFVISLHVGGDDVRQSFMMGARPDREFLDDELDLMAKIFEEIVGTFNSTGILNKFEIEVLTYAAAGLSMKQTSVEIGKSIDTVKKRLESARRALDATTTVQAISIAQGRNLITSSGSTIW